MAPQNLPAEIARKIVTGRQLADRRRRAPLEETLPTACPELDRLLAGGLGRGAMVEMVGRGTSGRFSLVLAVLAAATGCGEAAALVDLGDSFDPQGAEAAGVGLDRLLWARPRTTREALASAEAILASGIPLLVLDLGFPPIPWGRGIEAAWLRLARRAQIQRVALLVASPYRVSGTAAQQVIEVQGARPRWSGAGMAPRLLTGLDTRLALRKSRTRAGREEGLAAILGLRSEESLGIDPVTSTSDETGESVTGKIITGKIVTGKIVTGKSTGGMSDPHGTANRRRAIA